MNLLDLQRGLRRHILTGTGGDGVAPAAAPGLSVYHHAYRAQLVACLRDTYEKTWSWLGDAAFDEAALAHIEANPPSSWTLADYGGDFPQTLGVRYPDDPEIMELAWLEWTLRRAFDGPNAEPVAVEALAEVDWDAAVIAFVPTLAVGEVSTNCAAIWGALAESETPPPAERLPMAGYVRVWRVGLSPQFRTIEALEYKALVSALQGASFGRLCEALAVGRDPEEAARLMGGLLGVWLQDGMIQAVA